MILIVYKDKSSQVIINNTYILNTFIQYINIESILSTLTYSLNLFFKNRILYSN